MTAIHNHDRLRRSFATLLASVLVAAAAAAANAAGSGYLRAVASGQPVRVGPSVTLTPADGEVTDGLDQLYGIARAAVRETLAQRHAGSEADGGLTLKLVISLSGRDAAEAVRGSAVRGRDLPQPPFNTTHDSGAPDRVVVDQVRVPLGGREPPPDTEIAIAFFLYDALGNTLWSATINARGEIGDPALVIERMAKAAASAIGAHAERDFVLWCDGVEQNERTLCLD